MAGRDVRTLGKQIALSQVEVSAADPAAGNPDTDLPAQGRRHSEFSPLERFAIDRSRLMDDPGIHLAILTTQRR
jgi:hypothetical protein